MNHISKTGVGSFGIFGLLATEASENRRELVSALCANILLAWDIIITFDIEVELIWKAPKSVVTCLFLFNRYISLSQAIMSTVFLHGEFKTEHNICRVYAWYYAFSTVSLIWITNILNVYRVYAFFGRDRRILIVISTLGVINGGATLVMSILVVRTFAIFHTNIVLTAVGECILTNFPRLLHYIWVTETVFQSFLFFLMLARCIQKTVISWNKTMSPSNLYHLFIRDGIWAYTILLGMFIVSATQTNVSGLSVLQWAVTYAEIWSSRVILNLRSLRSPHANSSTYVISWSRWASEVVFDTIDESDDSDDVTIPDESIELQVMGRSEQNQLMEIDNT